MLVIKAKYFNHRTRQWEYLQEDGVDLLFDSYPDAQNAIMRKQLRAYNEDEFELETYIVCECGTMILRKMSENICPICGIIYNRWGKKFWQTQKGVQ